jgi:UDP-N-acetylmuramoyl-tripeptide--D-alanyl-D-alanine ligase
MVNKDSAATHDYLEPDFKTYDSHGALGWKVSDVKVEITGTSFKMTKDGLTLKLKSSLIGHHHIGPLSLVAALALEKGMTFDEVIRAISETAPYEHRMQPYKLNNAWVIDDTYNGNIEGMRVGTELLSELKAKRKIYVTPGLVDQGEEKESVHIELGKYIAKANPDMVVLMKNSATHFIDKGMKEGHFKNKLVIEDNPLKFYNNLDQFVAEGDIVLMQNDWPDQYK